MLFATPGLSSAQPGGPDTLTSLVAAVADINQKLQELGASIQAKQKGIDLKIVVVDQTPPIDTPLRDIATEVGEAFPGSTVLVLSPSESGTYSTTYDRMTLEAGQDVAEGRGAVQGAKNFVSELTTQHFPWTTFTILVVLGVVAAAVATRALQIRAKRMASDAKT
jgi:hypothetical protein